GWLCKATLHPSMAL
ncbi:unnamed protein product, partial [Adineta steineri]